MSPSRSDAQFECIYERVGRQSGQWHLAGDGDDSFRRIMCDPVEGINMPGNIQLRQPTCLHCKALVRGVDSGLNKSGPRCANSRAHGHREVDSQ